MGLSKVWVRTVADGLVRADSIIGITANATPAIAGKPSRWLLDIVLPTPIGSGSGGSWVSNPLHRTLAQTDRRPPHATEELAGLLARLDATDAAGVVTVERGRSDDDPAAIRFGFVPFRSTDESAGVAGGQGLPVGGENGSGSAR